MMPALIGGSPPEAGVWIVVKRTLGAWTVESGGRTWTGIAKGPADAITQATAQWASAVRI